MSYLLGLLSSSPDNNCRTFFPALPSAGKTPGSPDTLSVPRWKQKSRHSLGPQTSALTLYSLPYSTMCLSSFSLYLEFSHFIELQ